MKKLISLMLILCMACMLIPAMAADGAAGVWYANYYGAVMVLTLGEDGTASMTVSGNQMAAGTWAEKDGKIEITMKDVNDEESTQTAALADGVLTIADGSDSVSFTQEPIEDWTPGEVKTDAAAEDFEGEWTITKVNMMGVIIDASAAGMGDLGVKIENGAISFSGSADSITFYIGTDPVQMAFENGALSFSREIPNDAEPMTFVMKAEMLQDGTMALTVDLGYGGTTVYLTKAAAEEPAA
jgi:hypothetical protein